MNLDTVNELELQFRGLITTLPEDDQVTVKRLAESIRRIASDNGQLGLIALGLVGAEKANQ